KPRSGDDLAADRMAGLPPPEPIIDIPELPPGYNLPTLPPGLEQEIAAVNGDGAEPERVRTAEPPPRGLPEICVGGGRLPQNVDAVEDALVRYDKGIYQRGDFLVRPTVEMVPISDQRQTRAKRLVQIRRQHLNERAMRVCLFQKYNQKTGDWVPID